MKRNFLKFPSAPTSYAPRITSRRLRLGLLNHNIAYRSDGETAPAEETDDEVKAIQKIGKQVQDFQTALGERAKQEDFDALKALVDDLEKNISTMKADDITASIKAINEGNEKIWKQIAEMQEEKAQAKEAEGGARRKSRMFTPDEVKAFIDTTFKDGKKSRDHASVEVIKAPQNFAYDTFFDIDGTDIGAITGRVVDPELYQRRRKRNLILDNFPIRTINVPRLVYLIKVEDGDDVGSASGDSGSAAWILSGEIKPKRSFKVSTGEAEAKKVAIFGTVEDKLLRDVPSLERWIREDFMDEMREEINDGLLNNNPAVNDKAPLGLKTDAVQYTATPAYNNAFTANSTNYIDKLFAAFALMAYNREEAGIAFVSSDVYYRILHLKDSEARYQNNGLVYTDSLGRLFIGGVQIVWADEEDIPSTHVLVVGRDLGFKMYAYGPMVFERGLNGEDFRYDRTSFRGYQEFLTFFPANRNNSVMYDTWANITAAIEA